MTDENFILKSKYEQYKKRADYAKNKFFEAKNKKDAAVKEALNSNESSYRLKNTELKNEIKKIIEEKYKHAEEIAKLKSKLLQALQMNKT